MGKTKEEALQELLRLIADNPDLANSSRAPTKETKSAEGRQPPPLFLQKV